ncbi:MAG: hypothetical protein GXY85_02045 [Candidatus Brocadiaceae bacterium]|nr:hypothetical protein [Candidatus Brocadiaceae bacterium]
MSEEQKAPAQTDTRKAVPWGLVVGLAVAVLALAAIPVVRYGFSHTWGSNPMIATYILAGFVLAAEAALLILLRTARTRYTVERKILEHREVNEYVILWNRPRWVLYTPTLATALLFALGVYLHRWSLLPDAMTPRMLGGIWVVLCILNVMVEQFHMNIRTVLILVPTLGAVLLVLHLVNWAGHAVRLLRYFAVDVPPKLYFMAAGTIVLVLFVGWVRGLFDYIAITPNVADLQRGLTETGRQIKNADYDVDFDATDVVERWLFGFGRIIISFRDRNRPARVYFVPHASQADERIRRARSVTAIDRIPGEDLPI